MKTIKVLAILFLVLGLVGNASGQIASNPSPAHGAIHPDTWVTLSWSPGVGAASHDVYLGDNFDDVKAGTGAAFQGNQNTTYFVAGFPGFAYPDGLVRGTTYYWRIDEVDGLTKHEGVVWCFTIPPIELYGTVTTTDPDGVVHVLRHVMVTLDWDGTQHTVYTDDNGHYVIDMSNVSALFVGSGVTGFLQVTLQDEGNGTVPYIKVYNENTAKPIFVQTLDFSISTHNDLERNVNLSNNNYQNINTAWLPVPIAHLGDAAIIYFHTYQALDLALNTLGLSSDCALPVEVLAWSGGTWYRSMVSEIEIKADNSDFTSGNRPDNREWHEFGHFIMDDSMIAGDNAVPILHTGGFPSWPPLFPPWPPAPTSGDTNHGGYANDCTSDSWTEGFAEYISCLIAQETGDPNPAWYGMEGSTCGVNIEANWRAWEKLQLWGGPAEEYAVAGLLWDLQDGINPDDNDWIDLSVVDLWNQLNSVSHQNVYTIYMTLESLAWPALTGDDDSNGIDNLDELFIAHGLFSDADGDQTYDPGEAVGFTGDAARPNRKATPAIPGSYIMVNVIDSSTLTQVDVSEFDVEMRVEPPHDYLDADFIIRKKDNGSLYFTMPPTNYSARAYIYAKKKGYHDSAPLVIDSSYYWEKVREPGTEYIIDHTFYLTTEDILPPGLIAYWELDEIEGDVALDSAGTNHATLSGGPLWQPQGGQVGGALLFDGVDDCLITPFILNPAEGQFSVFAWIKDGLPGQVILSQIGSADWLYADQSQGKLATSLGPPPGQIVSTSLVSDLVISDGNWHRTGFVWDGSHRRLHVDGVISAEDSQVALAGSVKGLYIGCGKSMGAGTFWSGLIDDVRIYDVALSVEEIAVLSKETTFE